MGANPELEDRVPLRLRRENEIDAVAPAILNAARAFLAGGQAWEDGVLEMAVNLPPGENLGTALILNTEAFQGSNPEDRA